MTQAEIRAQLTEALEHLNSTLEPDQQITISDSLVLTGPDSVMDSLSLTTLFFDVEARLGGAGKTVDLFSAPFLLDTDTNTNLTDLAHWLSEAVAP